MKTRSERSDYNGYTNRATWNVALWLDNDEPSYRATCEFAAKHQGKVTPEKARWFAGQLFGNATPDGCKLASVNWTEIAEAINENYTAEVQP